MDLKLSWWRPVAGSFAYELVLFVDDRSGSERRRAMLRMVQEGVALNGLYWLQVLDTRRSDLDQSDIDWVLDVWERIADGRDPWLRSQSV